MLEIFKFRKCLEKVSIVRDDFAKDRHQLKLFLVFILIKKRMRHEATKAWV